MHRLRAVLVATPLLLGPTGAAFAHAHLKTAEPPVDGAVTSAPDKIAINLTEGVEPKFSSVEVQDGQGQRVDQGVAHTAPGDGKRLMIDVKPLPAGTYKVIWHATAVDTHKTDGAYQFTVKP